MDYFDSRWHGGPSAVAAAVDALDPAVAVGVIGPRTLDGVAYVAVRSVAPLTTPEGLQDTGAQLSAAVVGGWQ